MENECTDTRSSSNLKKNNKGNHSQTVIWGWLQEEFAEESTCNTGDMGDLDLAPGSGRPPGKGNDNPLQYSCLENPMDRAAWWATVHAVTKSQTQLSN